MSSASISFPVAESHSGHRFPLLTSPLRLGAIELKNRMVMGSMHTRIETFDRPLEREIAYLKARADGMIGMIVVGGISPNREGRLEQDGPVLDRSSDLDYHKALTAAVPETPLFLQILHAGRYSKIPECVSAGTQKSPISPYPPRSLSTAEVWRTIDDYVETAVIARECGYAGIEIMGSEGYFINQFLAPRTNQRSDEFGGSFEGRSRLAIEIVRGIRKRLGASYPMLFRISALELVEGGMTEDETIQLAQELERAGVDGLNTGIGWHEARIPTVAYTVPRAAWVEATRRLKRAVSVPVMASNRINDPFVAEDILRSGDADLVSLARQMFADPAFAKKVYEDKPEAINTCIACNQACLDRIFVQKAPSCLVNPRAVRELEFPDGKAAKPRKIAVIGGGPAGMTFSFNAAERGHAVTLFEAGPELGGQLLLAKAVPDKIEFDETLRYFNYRIKEEGVEVRTNTRATADQLAGFDHVVIATGVKPRTPEIKGIDGPNVVSYPDLLSGKARVGRRVAIIGAGGIGFDAAEYLLDHPRRQPSESEFRREYGVAAQAGGLTFLGRPQAEHRKDLEITIMQRSDERIGDKLSITIGWIKRDRLLRAGVKFRAGLRYRQITENGIEIETAEGVQLIEADTVVVCAGQESEKDLYHDLRAREISCSIIGGAHVAAEVDALRAIDEATRLAMEL